MNASQPSSNDSMAGPQDTIRPNALLVVSPQFQDQLYGEELIRTIRGRTRLLAPPMDPAGGADLGRSTGRRLKSCFPDGMLSRIGRSLPQKRRRGCARSFMPAAQCVILSARRSWERGVTLCSAFALNGEAVADYTVGAVLFSLKQCFAHAAAARRVARSRLTCRSPGVHDSNVGLISLGATGRAVARKLKPFGVNLVGYDPFVSTCGRQKKWECACGPA